MELEITWGYVQGCTRPRPSPFMRPFCLQGGGFERLFSVFCGCEGGGFERLFRARSARKRVFRRRRRRFRKFFGFSEKIVKKKCNKKWFQEKNRGQNFSEKMGLVKRAKNGKKIENTPLMGENFWKFRPQGWGFSSAFFGAERWGFERLFKTDAGLSHPWT